MSRFAARQSRRPFAPAGVVRRHKPDYLLFVFTALLIGFGLVLLVSISGALASQNGQSSSFFVSKHLVAVGLGLVGFYIASILKPKTWRTLEMPLLILAGIASILVRIIGEETNGAYRWIQVGGISFQAAELIKFALIVWLAGFLADRQRRGTLDDWNSTYKPLLIAGAIIGAVVVVLQSDLGSGMVMFAILGAMAFVSGIPFKKVGLAVLVLGILVMLAIGSSSYRRQRVQTFLNPTSDCQGNGYQACQALITIGSGGIKGLGLGNSVQAYGYLPEAGNDSIFAIVAEKLGFLGSSFVVLLLGALFYRMMKVIDYTADSYPKLLAVGALAWLSTQSIINIGAMLGLLPLKGITLPFISYGGTSLIFVATAVGMVFGISRYTSYKAIGGQINENTTSGGRVSRPHHAITFRR
ncbi:MAG: putative lipid II flippase FtsW [bacterium]|nr:putative lipid II flippase FtsW [bacterium]